MNASSEMQEHARRTILAWESGTTYYLPPSRDPFESLTHLMEAIEALCPQRPRREPTLGPTFLL